MSWDPTDDDPTARRPYYPESSGLCNCDDCNRPIPQHQWEVTTPKGMP